MKKISSFIPVHVINKNDLIKELSSYIYEVFPKDILDMIDVSTVKDNILIISCKNSSIATLMRFEKQKYLNLQNNNKICKILDYKGGVIWDKTKIEGQYRKPSSNKNFINVCKDFKYTSLDKGLKITCDWFVKTYPNIRGL